MEPLRERVKRYTFDQLAKRECAECTTTITTTKVDRYILASDYDAILAAVEEDREALVHDIDAYRGALGYSIPGDHNAKLTSGEQPICGLCDAREKLLAKAEAHEAALAAGQCCVPPFIVGDDRGNAICPMKAREAALREALKNARGMAVRHYREDGCEECSVLMGEIDAAIAKEGK